MSAQLPEVSLRCTVRGCASPLERAGREWRCERGHTFDVARSGYVNLLQPQDRRSARSGDSREAVAARERLEARGIGADLRAVVIEEAAGLAVPRGSSVLDVGAGTGLLLSELCKARGLKGWALDLSVHAASRCARREMCEAVVANADRRLPFADHCFALALSCTATKPFSELARVITKSGTLLVAVPAPDDLVELRHAAQGEGHLVDRSSKVLSQLGGEFHLERRRTVRSRVVLDRSGLEDLLASTYRGARRSERVRLEGLSTLEVTTASDLLTLRRSDPTWKKMDSAITPGS